MPTSARHEPLSDSGSPWRVFSNVIRLTLSRDCSGCSMEDNLTWGEGQGLGGSGVTAEEAAAVPGRAGAAGPDASLLFWAAGTRPVGPFLQ